MGKFLRNNIYLIPPIMVVATLISHWVTFDYVVIGNVLGYSILATIPMIYLFWFTKKYCWFTRLSVVALPLMNVVCIIGTFLNYNSYLYIYELAIIAVITILSIVLTIQKK